MDVTIGWLLAALFFSIMGPFMIIKTFLRKCDCVVLKKRNDQGN
jgi:hypothetical protein